MQQQSLPLDLPKDHQPGLPPGYYIDRAGNLTSYRGKTPRILAPYNDGSQYAAFTIPQLGHITRARLVALAWLPPPLPGQNIVRHLNGNPSDDRAENLAWGTQLDNMADNRTNGSANTPPLMRALDQHAPHEAERIRANWRANNTRARDHTPEPYRASNRASQTRQRAKRKAARQLELEALEPLSK